MGTCEVCGNNYARAFTVVDADGQSHLFDAFECAIHAIAPRCAHCACAIIGHGVQSGDRIFCCAQCARHMGAEGLVDHN